MARDQKGLQQSALHDFRNSQTVQQCLLRMKTTFGDSAPSRRTISRWFQQFRNGETQLGRQRGSGRKITAVTKANIAAVDRINTENPHATYSQIEHEVGIGSSSVKTIFHEKLKVRKL